jgi:hypothetical protein
MTNPSLVAFPGRLTITDAVGVPCPGAQLHISAKVEGSRSDAREPMAVYADAARTLKDAASAATTPAALAAIDTTKGW